jgi:hypothetical protein
MGDTGMSMRLHWKQDGQLLAYGYIPIASGDPICSMPDCFCNPYYGTSLMIGRMSLVPGQVNTLSLSATMNDVGFPNGSIVVSLNGRSETLGGITMRTNPNLKFNGILFASFFGGSDATWATPTDQELQFRDFTLQAS